ncbi:MAG: protein phosphatase 2C domain-containing protein, partial [Chlamydiales bacterium]|nr:protein phosphatase 2C domain-containing protein [Chlamydiales bacterium]
FVSHALLRDSSLSASQFSNDYKLVQPLLKNIARSSDLQFTDVRKLIDRNLMKSFSVFTTLFYSPRYEESQLKWICEQLINGDAPRFKESAKKVLESLESRELIGIERDEFIAQALDEKKRIYLELHTKEAYLTFKFVQLFHQIYQANKGLAKEICDYLVSKLKIAKTTEEADENQHLLFYLKCFQELAADSLKDASEVFKVGVPRDAPFPKLLCNIQYYTLMEEFRAVLETDIAEDIRRHSVEASSFEYPRVQVPLSAWLKDDLTLLEKAMFKKLEGVDFTCSKNLVCTAAATGQRRSKMEDTHTSYYGSLALKDGKSEDLSMTAIFDGHGGVRVAELAAKHLPRKIAELLQQQAEGQEAVSKVQVYQAINEAFAQFQQEVVTEALDSKAKSGERLEQLGFEGSTAVIALSVGSESYFINLGDSRAALVNPSTKEAFFLTKDQKPGDDSLSGRIYDRGGCVSEPSDHDPCRVSGLLSTAGAFGDFSLAGVSHKPVITCLSDIEETKGKMSRDGAKLILACDGLWDVLNLGDIKDNLANQEASKGTKLSSKYCADYLLKTALKAGTSDNVTVSVVNLEEFAPSAEATASK